MRTPHASAARRLATGVVLAATALIAGCGAQVPTDPNGSLDRITGGELRVGAVVEPGLVEWTGDEPAGPLVELAEDFADTVDADPEWTVGSEETLVTALEQGRLDLAVGGFTEESPWLDRAGVTRGYTAIPGAEGRSLVMLVPLGENALLTELETFLDEEVGS